ncbi:MAG: glycosyltransferase family 39 protein [Dehalococcoidia bacterium]
MSTGWKLRARSVLIDELWLAAIGAVWLGAIVRLYFVLSIDFPVNDGGMFYAMVRDIQSAHYRLPETTSYNYSEIPFAYPPLTFYVIALLNDAFGVSLLTLFRVVPLVGSLLTIPAFFLLSRSLLESRRAVVFSTFAFALIPRAFDWQISGGGLTRAWGLLFAILAIHQSVRLLVLGRQNAWPAIGILVALCALSHPEMPIYFGISFVVLLVVSRGGWPAMTYAAKAGSLSIVLASPWWLTVVLRDGVTPFTNAGGAGATAWLLGLKLFDPEVLSEPFFPTHLALGFLGAILLLGYRKPLLPVWLACLFIFEPRKAPTDATVVLAMLEGFAVSDFLLPAVAGLRTKPSEVRNRVAIYALVGLWIAGAVASPASGASPLASVSTDSRATAAWVAANTDPAAVLLIVTDQPWAFDSVSEWFPVLAKRRSAGTAQGFEWFGGEAFTQRQSDHEDLQSCADRDAICLETWARRKNVAFTHVFVTSRLAFAIKETDDDCCVALATNLKRDSRYKLVYSGPAGEVFERLPGPFVALGSPKGGY